MTDPNQTSPSSPQLPIPPFSSRLHALATRLDTMDAAAVRSWLDEVLAERVSLPRALPDDTPVPTLVALDPLLASDHLRRALRATVLDTLREAPAGEALGWSLLVLTELEDRQIGRLLAQFASGLEYANLPATAKCRVLSAIVDLRFHPGDPEFWRRLLQDNDAAAMSGLIFHAIAESDPHEAVALLPDLPTTERTLTQIALAHLPLLWESASKSTRETIRESLVSMRRDCRPELATALDQFGKEADVDLSPSARAVLGLERLDRLLDRFGCPKEQRQPIQAGLAA